MTQFVRPRLTALVVAIAMVAAAALGGAVIGSVGLAGATVDSGEKAITRNIDLVRIRDTRTVFGGPIGGPAGKLGTQSTEVIKVADTNGIPPDAKAVCINLTVLDATTDTFVTAFGALPRPNASTVNPGPGDTTVNGVLVPLDAGNLRIYNNAGSVNYFIDVSCYTEDHTHKDREPQVVHSNDQTITSIDFVVEATIGPKQTIVTDRSGYLDVRMPVEATVTCAPSAGIARYAYLTIDGVPIPSSYIRGESTSPSVKATLQGVTSSVIGAGTHEIGVGWECLGANTASNSSFSSGAQLASAIVIPD